MILFSEIYNKAITLFDDPKITQAYETNKIAFCKYMYAFLNNVSIYEPVIIGQILSQTEDPKGQLELFDADGVSNTFNIDMDIPENSELSFTQNGEVVMGQYDPDLKTVTFPDVLDVGGEYGLEYYYPGCFVGDFNSLANASLQGSIETKVKNILARLVVIAWAESVRDMLVDIQGILRDTDFKTTPNSQILTAKRAWVHELQRRNDAEQNKLSWVLRYAHNAGRYRK